MFIAMNRFKIARGFEEGFERVWRQRDSYLSEVPGFKSFSLLKGPERGDHVLYASHSIWESAEAFEGWTRVREFPQGPCPSQCAQGNLSGTPGTGTV